VNGGRGGIKARDLGKPGGFEGTYRTFLGGEGTIGTTAWVEGEGQSVKKNQHEEDKWSVMDTAQGESLGVRGVFSSGGPNANKETVHKARAEVGRIRTKSSKEGKRKTGFSGS